MRFLAIFLIQISVAFWNSPDLQKPVALSQKTTGSGNDNCEHSLGFVRTPLMTAIWQGNFEKVKDLISPRTNLNTFFRLEDQIDGGGALATPLTYAIHAKNASRHCPRSDRITELLLIRKADPNFHALHGITPLQLAASFADVSSVKLLLKYGANLEERNDGGETAIMIAAQRNDAVATVQELVTAGSDIHVVNNLGTNAVMLAAWQHRAETVKLLIDLGVDGCAKNKSGQTAMDMARMNLNDDPGKQKSISLLQAKCPTLH